LRTTGVRVEEDHGNEAAIVAIKEESPDGNRSQKTLDESKSQLAAKAI